MINEPFAQHLWELRHEPDDPDPDRTDTPCWCGAWTPNTCTCP